MRLNKLLLIGFYLICLSAFNTKAQTTLVIPETEEPKRFLYKNEWSGGISVSNRGFGAIGRYTTIPGQFMKIIYEGELVKIKHPKEIKVVNPYYNSAKSYVYGKENSFFTFRLGTGTRLLIFDRAPKDGVEISSVFTTGASLGLAKPIYLEILKESTNPYDPPVSEKFDKENHNALNILGNSGFFHGFRETKIHPGLYFKSGLMFDWSTKDEKVLCVEVGGVFDYYFKPAPIMAEFNNLQNKSSFISLYATILFGKKY